MIEVGALKLGDKVVNKKENLIGTVVKVEYNRTVDDEWEMIEIHYDNTDLATVIYTPDDSHIKLEKIKKEQKGETKMTAKELWVDDKLFAKGQDKYRVIINDPAVILFVEEWNPFFSKRQERKYVSKAHNEEFDPEKGLLMCLAKANGISHLDLKRMLKKATKQNVKKEEVKKEPAEKWTKEEIKAFYRPDDNKETQEPENTNPHRFDYEYVKEMYETCGMVEEYKPAKSPCGKHIGKPYTFEIGDQVVVRDCFNYKYQASADISELLNKCLVVSDIFEDNFSALYIVKYENVAYAFAGSELEPIWED